MQITYIDLILIFLFLITVLLIVIWIQVFSQKKNDNTTLLEQFKLHSSNAQLAIVKELLRELGNFKWEMTEKLESKFWKLLKENRENQNSLQDNLEKFLNKTDSTIEKNLKNNTDTISSQFKELTTSTKDSLEHIGQKVDKKLEKWFEKTNETFQNIISRLAKIDQAQKNIDKLNTEVVSLQNVLTDNKTRGIFGEVQLQSILENVFWENNKKIYEMQYHFKENNTQVDAVIKTPKWLICIDAKFGLGHYEKMRNRERSKEKRKESEKFFIAWIKKQIIEISSKYILPNITLDHAFLFLPAEAIFAEINAYYPQISEFAHKNHVSIVSPTTLMAMLTIIANTIRGIETQKQAQVIQTELTKLSSDFGRFEYRWNKFTKDFKTVWKDIDDIDITNKKIISRFGWIERLELKEKE